ncbi:MULTISPECIES: hypothetical protein [unclassified Lysinibacillus]|uniref:hypothetical protein n=1 Tax=unclassified Lysinibacillus TaxID=2636778 RepID=UPI00088DCC5B|nr:MULTISPECIES: hypothetical protein [unclassified Lysinibacillus]SCY87170.1 hypothetical protein SAMN02787078_02809 [Lysinibacillus sp. SG9]SDB38329.1 hypothetical protein SAMN02787079_02849 [Lysinibacillus sp. TC-37]SFT02343.1 hypothetical protein SAMN02787087_03104 [Lysinibacillus sp. SG55]
MYLKADWSFLEKITMGAIGTQKITEILNSNGHNIIELERYSSSNKIWATKIKRLRIPDLICLNCGKRIESRAKSKLGIIMSDSTSNVERRWYVSLRDSDLVAFIKCTKDTKSNWIPSNTINLFEISQLKASEAHSNLGEPKSLSEGAERDRTWKSYIPSFDGQVTSIEENKIKFQKVNGRNQTYTKKSDYNYYVNIDDSIEAGSVIVGSIVQSKHALNCVHNNYDFIADVSSEDIITKYCAIKSLGYLPHLKTQSVPTLNSILFSEEDIRVKIELFSTLLRLGENKWTEFKSFYAEQTEQSMKMEIILILGELIEHDEAQEILLEIALDTTVNNELRACSIWNLGKLAKTHSKILPLIADEDELVAIHTIAIIEKHLTKDITSTLLECIGENNRIATSAIRILSNSNNLDDSLILDTAINESDIVNKNKLLFTIGTSEKQRFENDISKISGKIGALDFIKLLWSYQANWLSPDLLNKIEFTKLQN